jgi:3-oxoacyl-(acyl-carrier-protein) synthase
MSVYINGIGAITPQGCYPSADFLKKMNVFGPGRMTVVEPSYRDFIKPVPLRRMSKFIKMGLTSALMCLKDAGIEKPDAIITATGLGAVEDTDKFLDNLTDDNENLLNPTPFIQSTHNAVAARIAIETGCHNYNMTFVHKNASFEQGLLDAYLKINNGESENILVGGTEEITEANYELKKNVEFWKENVGNDRLLENNTTKGTIAGEGSVFFNLSQEKDNGSYAELKSTKTLYKLPFGLNGVLVDFLASARLTPEDIDVVLLGINGNVEEDFIYDTTNELFKNSSLAWYKHLCGEYETSSAFAMLIASWVLKNQKIPEVIKLNNIPAKEIKKILIYQQRFNRNHSFTILSKC